MRHQHFIFGIMELSSEQCVAWIANPLVNPITQRKIKKDGQVYKEISKACEKIMRLVEKNKKTMPIDMSWNEKNNRIFHLSEFHLQNFLLKLQDESSRPIDKEFAKEVQSVLETKNKKNNLRFERVLDKVNVPSHLSYDAQSSSPFIRELSLFNCHDGQRKLTLGFLEFLSKAMIDLSCKPKDIFIVYAGSSALASAIALTIFPELLLATYDPDPNIVTFLPSLIKDKTTIYRQRALLPEKQIRMSPLMVFTDKAGWFDDHVARYCKNVLFPLSKRKHLLFVSDVRAETGEYDIVKDMRAQMRWTMMLSSSYYMHKFRLPYFDASNQKKIKDMYEDTVHVHPFLKENVTIRDTKEKDNPKSVLYIDGDMYIQPFGPQRTTEFRLIGKPHLLKGYGFRYYNVHDIESKAALFNNVYRSYASYQHPEFAYVSFYEKIAEFDILLCCLKTGSIKEKIDETHIRNIFQLVNTLMHEIVKAKSNMDACKYVSLMKAISKTRQKYYQVVPQYFDRVFKSST